MKVILEVRMSDGYPVDIAVLGGGINWDNIYRHDWTNGVEFETLQEAMDAYPIKDNLKMMERLIAAGLL